MNWIIFFILTSLSNLNVQASENCISSPSKSINVMTFNIQINTSRFEVAPWPVRAKAIAALVKSHDIEVVGFQEVLNPMLADLARLLPEYEILSAGRDDGKKEGEHSSLFYKKDRLQLLDSGFFWLSPTPDQPGSKGWDAWSPRMATWAVFRDRDNQNLFSVVNTHFDHWGSEARKKSAHLLGQFRLNQKPMKPTVILADLNSKAGDAAHRTLTQDYLFKDAMVSGPHSGPNWTHSFYGIKKSKIDFILTTRDIETCQHQIIEEDSNAGFRRSDHLPVKAILKIIEPAN